MKPKQQQLLILHLHCLPKYSNTDTVKCIAPGGIRAWVYRLIEQLIQ
jgi:hypothetical protein